MASAGQAFLLHDTNFAALHDELGAPAPKLLRFPVLAHWSFTCSEDPDFQALAASLDVGLLGKQPQPGEDQRSTGFEVADTGHTVVDRITRRGEPGQAWYRGAFTPREVRRRPAAGPGETDPRARAPYHAAEQAIRLAEDGREDISEAAAFELGRALALADPVFAGALAAWRRAGFALRRLASARAQVPGIEILGTLDGQLSRVVAAATVTAVSTPLPVGLAGAGTTALGPVVPRNDLAGLLADTDAAAIADGLALPRALVDDVLASGLTRTPLPRDTPDPKLPTGFDELAAHKETLAHLERRRDDLTVQLDADSNRPPAPGFTGLDHSTLTRVWPHLARRARTDGNPEDGAR
jgi:hypothetical protein